MRGRQRRVRLSPRYCIFITSRAPKCYLSLSLFYNTPPVAPCPPVPPEALLYTVLAYLPARPPVCLSVCLPAYLSSSSCNTHVPCLYRRYGHDAQFAAMPKSVASYYSYTQSRDGDDEDEELDSARGRSFPPSPDATRKHPSARNSELDLRSRLPSRLLLDVNEQSGLLANPDSRPSYRSVPASPRLHFKRRQSQTGSLRRNHSRHGSLGYHFAKAFAIEPNRVPGRSPLAPPTLHVAFRPGMLTRLKQKTTSQSPKHLRTTTTAYGTTNSPRQIGFRTQLPMLTV